MLKIRVRAILAFGGDIDRRWIRFAIAARTCEKGVGKSLKQIFIFTLSKE